MSSYEKPITTKDELIGLVVTPLEKLGIPDDFIASFSDLYARYWELMKYPEIAPVILTPEQFHSPDENLLAEYRNAHKEYYEPKVEELVKKYEDWNVTETRSGMFGGKTSLIFYLLDRLKDKGVKSEILISSVMGEDFVTGRGYMGEKIRGAIRFGNFADRKNLPEEIQKLFVQNVDLIVLDEYTFANPNDVIMLMKWAEFYKKKLILLGLGTNYLGEELPIFNNDYFQSVLDRQTTQKVVCKSFTNGELPLGKPEGEGTIRYLKIDGKWVLDLGLGQMIISKEMPWLVNYRASRYTLKSIIDIPFFTEILTNTPVSGSELAQHQVVITNYLNEQASKKG